MNGEIIKQVMIFDKSGICVHSVNYWSSRWDADIFGSLLSAINQFTKETLNVEPYELVTPECCVFLHRTEEHILTIITNESACNDSEVKLHISSLMATLCQILESDEYTLDKSDQKSQQHLTNQIELEVARIFSTFANQIVPDQVTNDLIKIRILTHLSDQNDHTATTIMNKLHVSQSMIQEKLSSLDQEGYVLVKAFFRQGEHWTYSISEIGKFALSILETQFPGLWF